MSFQRRQVRTFRTKYVGNFSLGTEDIYISDHKIKVAWVGVEGLEEVNREVYMRGGCKLDFRFFLYCTACQHPAQKASY